MTRPGFHPRFRRLAGQPQSFTPFPIALPTLGTAMLGPGDEMVTAVLDRAGVPQPMIIIAAEVEGAPPLALGFQPTPEQALRMAKTLTDFAEGRAGDLLREAQG